MSDSRKAIEEAMRVVTEGDRIDAVLMAGARMQSVPVAPESARPSPGLQNVAAALAGGMIAASGQPHTPAEAVAVYREVLALLRQADQD